MSKGRILGVDDEEDILELVKYNLEREGYLVDCVETGEEAIERATAVRPDGILLDLMLPGVCPAWTESKSAGNCGGNRTPGRFRSS